MRRRLKAIWTKEWTALVGYIQWLSGAIIVGFSYVGDLVSNSDVKAAISAMSPPVYVGLGLALIGAITLLSRPHAA